jgi:hypothetical protein
MKINYSASVIAIIMVLSSLALCSEGVVGMTTEQALQVVTNCSSSSNDFVAAMKQLEPVSGDKSFWLKLAEDQSFDADRRRRYVKHLFEFFAPIGMRLDEFPGADGRRINWISYDRIRKVKRGDIGGWVPESLLKGKSGFSIPILFDAGGHYNLVIFVSLREDLRLEDLLGVITAKGKGSAASEATIIACTPWDSDDQERKFPGSKSHSWPW